MQARRFSSALVATVMFSTVAFAEELQVPQPSPAAKVEQVVGVTRFTVDYSSPAVRGREVWGALVPYDKPWRTGANAATKFSADGDFTFGGKKVAAGTYSLYTVPGKTNWTVVLNSAADRSGAMAPEAKKDVVRVTVKPQTAPARERMTFLFSDTTDSDSRLDLEWAGMRVSVPLHVETQKMVTAGIDKVLDEAWRPHFTAARWMLENGGDAGQALKHVDTSISIKPTWWNNWVRAQILAKQGKTSEAAEAGAKAQQLGKGDRVYEGFFKQDVEKTVASWKKSS